MIALLQKDWRLNRVPVVATIIVFLIPYLIGIIALAYSSAHDNAPGHDQIAEHVLDLSMADFRAVGLLSAAYGAVAFAHERRERSADFLAMLPASRLHIVLSKVSVALVCVTIPLAINVFIFTATRQLNTGMISSDSDDWVRFGMFGGMAMMMFGIAWLCSAFLTSPAISFAIAGGSTFGLVMLISEIVSDHFPAQSPSDGRMMIVITAGTFLTGILSVIAGSIYWLKRVEP